MIAATCALLLLSTSVCVSPATHCQDLHLLRCFKELGVNITRLYRGFITRGPHLPGGSDQYFAGASDPTFLVKSILYDFQTAILDAVVVGILSIHCMHHGRLSIRVCQIYRAYVVWQSVFVIAVPVLGWVALIGMSDYIAHLSAVVLIFTQSRASVSMLHLLRH